MSFVQEQSVFYLANVLFLKVIFILISLVFLAEISKSCVSGVATENLYLLSFVALVLIMLRAAYLFYKYFFSHILVSIKKGLQGNVIAYWNRFKFLLLPGIT